MSQQITLNVEGMHCGNCAGKVKAALLAVKGVSSAEVDLPAKAARVTAESANVKELMQAVSTAGFRATGFSAQ